MAKPPILSLKDISLTFGGAPLFAGVDLAAGDGDRLCLVGRNGSGKSTLLKIAAGQVGFDAGERFVQPGKHVAYLPQDPDLSGHASLLDYAAADVPPEESYKAEMALEGLRLDGSLDPATASGGEKRRAALARLLAAEPDLMLLDEPTNHLDITAIEWLEETLLTTRTGYILISHDRALMAKVTRGTLWLDRGVVRRSDKGFAGFEDWRDRIFEEEDAALHKLDQKIRREQHWIVHGVSGRRKRNVRRVGELAALREQRSTHLHRAGPAAMALESGSASGRMVIEAKGIAKGYDGRVLVSDFSTRIMRGDRVAFVGPNGAGKTTLLRMLTGEIEPDAGTVRRGSNIALATLDQKRDLDGTKTLWETMTEDDLLGVKGSNDQILVRGTPRHVIGYLKDFLFDEKQARGPVSALSGGERARLMLAKIMARESNLLVLDEPTNDLDIETLDLLQDLLAEYDGTLLLVSHDRDFIDRIATSTIAMEGDGRAIEYAGGYSDYRAQRGAGASREEPARRTPAPKPDAPRQAAPGPAARPARKMSFKQTRRLDLLPGEMEALGAEIDKLEALLADPDLYARDAARFEKASRALAERRERLAAMEEEWLELEEMREAAS